MLRCKSNVLVNITISLLNYNEKSCVDMKDRRCWKPSRLVCFYVVVHFVCIDYTFSTVENFVNYFIISL